MKIIVPIKITDAMLSSSTIAEPDTGETAWVSAGTYVAGDERIRTTTHKRYICILGHTGVTTFPENDATHWTAVKNGTTNRWMAFDTSVSTASTATGSMTIVLQPGFFNAIGLYNLTGSSIEVTVKDTPGGAVIFYYSGDLFESFPDFYEWLFSPYKPLTKLVLDDILPYDTAELTITVTAGASDPVGIGMISIGDMRPFITSKEIGGTQYGARIEPVDYSYVKTDDYGVTSIVKRAATTNLNASVFLPREDADYVSGLLTEILSVPVAVIASEAPWASALSVFGLVSGSIEYAGPNHAIGTITVKGLT